MTEIVCRLGRLFGGAARGAADFSLALARGFQAIVLRDGKRVVITDPKDIRDPLSDVIIKLAAELHELREKFQQHSHATLGSEPDLRIDQETATPNISPQELFQDDYQI